MDLSAAFGTGVAVPATFGRLNWQEHEEHEQRSRELLRKHKMLLHERGSESA